eukprot:7809984-Pyramimonas_sp.AAC.1
MVRYTIRRRRRLVRAESERCRQRSMCGQAPCESRVGTLWTPSPPGRVSDGPSLRGLAVRWLLSDCFL